MIALGDWVLTWKGALAAYGISCLAFTAIWAIACAPRRREERAIENAARWQALRDELEDRRRTTGWFESQAYFDAECECIEIAERRRAQIHPSTREPKP